MTYVLIFLAALTFSGHCIGMCGLFSVALRAKGAGRGRSIMLLLLYHGGRTFTYLFLGVAAAAAGARFDFMRQPLGVAAGALLLLLGLGSLRGTAGLAPQGFGARVVRWIRSSPLCWIFSGLIGEARPMATFSAGIFNGFVPCGLVYAMLAYAASLGSPGEAALAMLAFGAGTIPALALLGISADFIRARLLGGAAQASLSRAAGLLTAGLGVMTLVRALGAVEPHAQHLINATLP